MHLLRSLLKDGSLRSVLVSLLFVASSACALAGGDALSDRGTGGAAVVDDACDTESEPRNSSGAPGGDAFAEAGDGEDAVSVARAGQDGASATSIDIRVGDRC